VCTQRIVVIHTKKARRKRCVEIARRVRYLAGMRLPLTVLAFTFALCACANPDPDKVINDEVGVASTDDGADAPCWKINDYTWCTVPYHGLLVGTPCESMESLSTDWNFNCALNEPIDLSGGWDAAWCTVPECIVTDTGATPATEWTDGCAQGQTLPTDHVLEEWRCGANTCAVRMGSIWVFSEHTCKASEWAPC
jgi:hypothetical protein